MAGVPSLELRMDDVRAVMDTVGSKHAALAEILRGRVRGLCCLPRPILNVCRISC